MKTAEHVLSNAMPATRSHSTSLAARPTGVNQAEEFSPDDGRIINMLFNGLEVIFSAWSSQLPVDAEQRRRFLDERKRQWLRGLKENNINTEEHIQVGLQRARQEPSNFPPSIGTFIQWCQDIERRLGLPSKEEAFKQAVNRFGDKHIAVIHTLNAMTDVYRFQLASEHVARAIWDEEWASTIRFLVQGGVMELPSGNDDEEEEAPAAAPEEVVGWLAKMKKALK